MQILEVSKFKFKQQKTKQFSLSLVVVLCFKLELLLELLIVKRLLETFCFR